MQIYTVADIHGKSNKIALIRANMLKFKPDVLVVAGDITNYLFSVTVVAQLNDMPTPVLAVRGNTDLPKVEKLLEDFPNISSLHLKEVNINGIPFVGVSGTVPVPFSSRICFNEVQVIEKLEPLVKRDSVLVAHPPPWGTQDEVFGRFHAGCHSLKKVIKKHQPRLMICGHIHERPGPAFIGSTLVVNCALGRNRAGAMIEIDKDKEPRAEMLYA